MSLLLRLLLLATSLLITPQARAEVDLDPKPWAKSLADGRRHLDVLLPNLEDTDTIDALRAAAKSGRRVRVLFASDAAGAKSGACRPCARLATAGAALRHLETPVLDTFALLD